MKTTYNFQNLIHSCLHSLKSFHVTSGLPPVLVRDLLEGFAIAFISNKIKHCTLLQYFTLGELNDIILTFPYSTNGQSSKPQPIRAVSVDNFKVKLTACEMWNFLGLFPLKVGHLVSKTDKKWILFFYKLSNVYVQKISMILN